MFSQLIQGLRPRLPSQCAVCRRWPAQPVCGDCVAEFAQPVPRCRTCAIPVPGNMQQCGDCITDPPPVDACIAAVAYAYPWSGLIAQFKFQELPGRAGSFAVLMRSAPWVEPALDAADLLIPMPLSAQRLRERGFNQALVLARTLARDKVASDLLLRIQHTPPQRSLPRRERLQSVMGAYAVDPLKVTALHGKRVVLLDDVMTSGASLHAAAHALRTAGVAHITAMVLARTE
jgi:ComF family protein